MPYISDTYNNWGEPPKVYRKTNVYEKKENEAMTDVKLENAYKEGKRAAYEEAREYENRQKESKSVFRKKFWGFFFWYLWTVVTGAMWAVLTIAFLLNDNTFWFGVGSVVFMTLVVGFSLAANKADDAKRAHDERVSSRNDK